MPLRENVSSKASNLHQKLPFTGELQALSLLIRSLHVVLGKFEKRWKHSRSLRGQASCQSATLSTAFSLSPLSQLSLSSRTSFQVTPGTAECTLRAQCFGINQLLSYKMVKSEKVLD